MGLGLIHRLQRTQGISTSGERTTGPRRQPPAPVEDHPDGMQWHPWHQLRRSHGRIRPARAGDMGDPQGSPWQHSGAIRLTRPRPGGSFFRGGRGSGSRIDAEPPQSPAAGRPCQTPGNPSVYLWVDACGACRRLCARHPFSGHQRIRPRQTARPPGRPLGAAWRPPDGWRLVLVAGRATAAPQRRLEDGCRNCLQCPIPASGQGLAAAAAKAHSTMQDNPAL
jgi:hypothetical protein